MESSDLNHIDQFVLGAGSESLFEYFEVSPDSPEEEKVHALDTRRRWAQGQQSNPKYKQEALWIIKHQALCREAVLDDMASYLAHIQENEALQQLADLGHFIEGALDHGEIGLGGVQKVLEQGAKTGLTVPRIQERIDQVLAEHGALRREAHDEAFVDHYEILGIHPTSSIEEAEQAYRERYQEARREGNTRTATQHFARLDQAWDVIGSETFRAAFDVLRAANQAGRPVRTDERPESHTPPQGTIPTLHRSPGELEKEIVPASPEGIGFAREQLGAPRSEGLVGHKSTTIIQPAEAPSDPIRFSLSRADQTVIRPSKLRPAEPSDAPKAPAVTSKASRVPLSSRKGPSPFIWLALLVLFLSIACLYWVMQE